jgi:serine O-acetyltransferase
MIRTKEDLYTYVNYDKCAYGGKPSKITDSRWSHVGWMVIHILKDWRCNYKVFNFLFALRMHEYYANMQNKGWLEKIAWRYWRKKHDGLGVQLGFDIPINVFGPGLRINHYGLIVVNGNARVGAFCDIHQGVNIGNWGNDTDVPIIGDNVWIGSGAKISGEIVIGSCCVIGANVVVNKNFPDEGMTIAGIPTHIISDKGNPWRKEYFKS